MAEELVGTHVFNLTPTSNGGESILMTTKLYDNGDGEHYYSQELTLHSYCNAANFELVGSPLTPRMLRELANELDSFLARNKK